MEIPKYSEIVLLGGTRERNPLENFIYSHEPNTYSEDKTNKLWREELQKLVDWLSEQPQVTCAECGEDCRYDGPFYCSEHQR